MYRESLTRHISRSPSILTAAMTLLLALSLSAGRASAATVPVNEGNATWTFVNPGGTFAAHGYVQGPDTPPSGSGSMYVYTDLGTDIAVLQTQAYAGMPLSYFTELSYSTHQNHSILAVQLIFEIDYDCTDNTPGGDGSIQGRLYFDTYFANGQTSLTPNSWQSWDTMVGPGWWGTATRS